jgi:hypothetical protein
METERTREAIEQEAREKYKAVSTLLSQGKTVMQACKEVGLAHGTWSYYKVRFGGHVPKKRAPKEEEVHYAAKKEPTARTFHVEAAPIKEKPGYVNILLVTKDTNYMTQVLKEVLSHG